MRRETLIRLRQLGFPSYTAYLRSDLWRSNKKRLKLRKSCFICGKRTALHAHHASYENIGAEQPGDIIVLCSAHHRGVHNFKKRRRCKLEEAHVLYAEWLATRPKRKPRKRP